jgi:O-antigen/teichoic acid export membrane protein
VANDNNITLKDEPGLYKSSIRGGFWVFFLQLVSRVLGFGKTLVVVNYLFLDDLGLIAVAIMLMSILDTFSESGFQSALVQKKGDIREYLDTAWVVAITRSVILFAVLYFSAPVFASFKVPDEKMGLAISVIRITGLCLLIQGFSNVGAVYFEKELDFRKRFMIAVSTTTTDIVFSVVLVIIYRSIWGYIAARLISVVVGCVMSYVLCPYRPRFRFRIEKAKNLWDFGRWIFGTRVLGFMISEGDDFFVWFYLGLPSLALYRYAFRFATMPGSHISEVISSVTFPAYSKIQQDCVRLRDAYLKVLKSTALLSLPSAFLIFFLGPYFVRLFLPDRMHGMTLVLQILALKGLMSSVSATYGPVFKAIGKPRIMWHVAILCLVVLAVTIYPFTRMWGIAGTASATVLVGLLTNPLYFFLTKKVLHCSFRQMSQSLLPPFGASALMLAVLLACKWFLFREIGFILFFGLAIIGLIAYLIAMWMIDAAFKCGFREIVVEFTGVMYKRVRRA